MANTSFIIIIIIMATINVKQKQVKVLLETRWETVDVMALFKRHHRNQYAAFPTPSLE